MADSPSLVSLRRMRLGLGLLSGAILLLPACSNGGSGGSGGNNLNGSSATSGATSASAAAGTGGAGGASSTASAGGAGGMASGGAGGGGGAGGSGGQPCVAALGPLGLPDVDDDGDGWTELDGDCCEDASVCPAPGLVNPGAFEVLFDCMDNDCNPNTPDDFPIPDCGGSPLATPVSATKLTKALDLCQFTVETPPSLNQKVWGVISNDVAWTDGTGAPKDAQMSVLGQYGPNVLPHAGATMAALSNGEARDEPLSIAPEVGYDAATSSPVSAAYLAANGGTLPISAACPACVGAGCAVAFDPVSFSVRVRVPTNADGFKLDAKFYTAEFPTFTCGAFSDRFVALYDSLWQPGVGMLPLPADKNIALDSLGHPFNYDGLFDVCQAPPGAPPGTCPLGTAELVGTGMGGLPINGQVNLSDGAGTAWVVVGAPAVPGETVELTFQIWDVGDHGVDSLVLLDNFRWDPIPP